ncbi:hypothetical protein [Hymenobacter rigui]|uniref:Uncharacterized protein n=1 Tax=Hymenobacter rigui TaxID=334424 RepID=A0A3R9P5Z0_9BACT|nr:hypothetical protein [Hymenobacter rigui]RSK49451.1 hypothetical protein EI291_08145 [Hymenobacter rigui]
MQTLRSRLALVLLLCFARVLLPDTWILALHTHEHTTEEPTQATGWPKGKALVSAKHQHCDADQFFKSAFEPAAALPVTEPATPAFATLATVELPIAWHQYLCPTADLRGPPSRA